MVGRPERGRSTRLHRFNPLVRPEPAAAETESTRTIARWERRVRARGLQTPFRYHYRQQQPQMLQQQLW